MRHVYVLGYDTSRALAKMPEREQTQLDNI